MPDIFQSPADYWSRPAEQVLAGLHSSSQGLNSSEAQKRLQAVGPNTLKVRKRATAWGLFLNQFKSPLVLILLFATAVSVFAKEYTDAVVILLIVVGSAVITFVQEYSASNAVEQLRARLVHKVTALRDGKNHSIPAEEVVPGDVLLLSAGSLIPADGLILEAKDFFVNQAVLTGETFRSRSNRGLSLQSPVWPNESIVSLWVQPYEVVRRMFSSPKQERGLPMVRSPIV